MRSTKRNGPGCALSPVACDFIELLHGARCHPVILSSCHPVILSSCHPVILSSCHPVILSSCHPVILSSCHPVMPKGAELRSEMPFFKSDGQDSACVPVEEFYSRSVPGICECF